MRWAVLFAGAVVSLAGCLHVPTVTPTELPGGVTPHSFRMRPALPGDQPIAPPRTAPPQSTQVVATITAPRPVAPLPQEPRPLPAIVQTAAVLPSPRPVPAASTGPIVLAAYRPEPATPKAGHAGDLRWLVGELTRNRGRWGVRFGEANDRHGGHLVLLDPGHMDGLRPGQLVRVEGALVEPGPHEVEPSYRVRALVVVRR